MDRRQSMKWLLGLSALPMIVTGLARAKDASGPVLRKSKAEWAVLLPSPAYRVLFEMTYRTDLQLRFRFEPGDLIAFDNRRVLHARSEFTDVGGRRHLRGCYTERDELYSRLRMLERSMREKAVSASHSTTR